ncbi:MAG: hypothetical protein R2742_14670 [Micropruina glycogenica]
MGLRQSGLFKALKEARETGDAAAQKAKYEEINKMIADFVPGVPLTHAPPSLAFGKGVRGYPRRCRTRSGTSSRSASELSFG